MNRGSDITKILQHEFPMRHLGTIPRLELEHRDERMWELLDIALKEAYEQGRSDGQRQAEKQAEAQQKQTKLPLS